MLAASYFFSLRKISIVVVVVVVFSLSNGCSPRDLQGREGVSRCLKVGGGDVSVLTCCGLVDECLGRD